MTQMYAKQHIRMINDTSEQCSCIADTPFLTPIACKTIISLAETFATENGGWTTESKDDYEQTTTDLELDKMSDLKNWLRDNQFIEHIQRLYQAIHGVRIVAFNDVFIVKYSADHQTELVEHFDAGDITFMIALSDPNGMYQTYAHMSIIITFSDNNFCFCFV